MVAAATIAVVATAIALASARRAGANHEVEVRVAAAASLRPALDAVVRRLHASEPDLHVVVSYGSSGTLAAQILRGAPFDVFLSADKERPDRVVANGGAAATDRFTFASGSLVLAVRSDLGLDLGRGLDLVRHPAVRRIAIAQPQHAPYGRAALGVLQRRGLLDSVRERLIYGENVAQALAFVQSGGADAGLVAASLTTADEVGESVQFVAIDARDNPSVDHVGVVLRGARDRGAALQLRNFLVGPAGRAALSGAGLRVLADPITAPTTIEGD